MGAVFVPTKPLFVLFTLLALANSHRIEREKTDCKKTVLWQCRYSRIQNTNDHVLAHPTPITSYLELL